MNTSLDKFILNNSYSKIKETSDHYLIERAWNDETFNLRFRKVDDFLSFENIQLPKELCAIYHFKNNRYEFIFSPLKNDDECLKRSFEFIYEGRSFKASFHEPTDIFKQIAKAFIQTESVSGTEYRNLQIFRDFYRQDKLPDFVKKFFNNKIPVNFFIEGPFNELIEPIKIFKHLNFYLSYFDRSSPNIVILDSENLSEDKKYEMPCLSKENGFPATINMGEINDVLLGLMAVARETKTIRLKYLFYYQILEYCSYYYLNSELKMKLHNIIKNPDLLNDSDKYSQYIIEVFKDHFKSNDDSQKLEKVIVDFCYYSDIKNEINANSEYFIKDLIFDGGFILPSLFNTKEEINSPSKTIMSTIKNNIEKIRNVLVHIRESRENKIILPTEHNNNLLIPYLYIIRRIAEITALRFE
jgi:hypothetical protein